jgi:hypothetical protein
LKFGKEGEETEKVETSFECPSEDMLRIRGMTGGSDVGDEVRRRVGRRSRVRR